MVSIVHFEGTKFGSQTLTDKKALTLKQRPPCIAIDCEVGSLNLIVKKFSPRSTRVIFSFSFHRSVIFFLSRSLSSMERLIVELSMGFDEEASDSGPCQYLHYSDNSPFYIVVDWKAFPVLEAMTTKKCHEKFHLESLRGNAFVFSLRDFCQGMQKMKMAPDHMSTSVCLEIEKMYLCLANILLDDDCEAVVGEFGLAKLLDHRHSHDTTTVRGAVGHIAPEYLSTGQSSDKTDVFGFGILLLELISGQRALEFGKEANQKGAMLDWDQNASDLCICSKEDSPEKKLDMLVSKDLKDKYDRIDLEEMVQVDLICYGKQQNLLRL
ncbi:Protein NSP-INTERACTING KINASE 1 [Capsicum baccatum]|uniref:non-specific serine/threonine protein kinase n=1 Tax=Capsicum baccatum TaxID=33114 RepID=A0A2G2XP73_CAPBA|nr:Protein NSP-INTERACTING KINASE 1 [Capsicum baccatum]